MEQKSLMCKFDLHRWKKIFEIIKLQKLERKFQYVNWNRTKKIFEITKFQKRVNG